MKLKNSMILKQINMETYITPKNKIPQGLMWVILGIIVIIFLLFGCSKNLTIITSQSKMIDNEKRSIIVDTWFFPRLSAKTKTNWLDKKNKNTHIVFKTKHGYEILLYPSDTTKIKWNILIVTRENTKKYRYNGNVIYDK